MKIVDNSRLVAYYRVSTSRQGVSGLGLEAQKQAVAVYVERERGQLIAEFTEVESGKSNTRPELLQALALCERSGARLVIAKLDRLSRNAAFLLSLRDANVDFVACDMPQADRFTVGVLALVAEREREQISERTKAALRAAKARGTKLGNPRLAEVRSTDLSAAREARQSAGQAWQEKVQAIVRDAYNQTGTLSGAARCLNDKGERTRRGAEWTAIAVARVLSKDGAT